jgi:hypothetical protein
MRKENMTPQKEIKGKAYPLGGSGLQEEEHPPKRR